MQATLVPTTTALIGIYCATPNAATEMPRGGLLHGRKMTTMVELVEFSAMKTSWTSEMEIVCHKVEKCQIGMNTFSVK